MYVRYLRYKKGTSNKSYAIFGVLNKFVAVWGRYGSRCAGCKTIDSLAMADALHNSKIAKGYTPVAYSTELISDNSRWKRAAVAVLEGQTGAANYTKLIRGKNWSQIVKAIESGVEGQRPKKDADPFGSRPEKTIRKKRSRMNKVDYQIVNTYADDGLAFLNIAERKTLMKLIGEGFIKYLAINPNDTKAIDCAKHLISAKSKVDSLDKHLNTFLLILDDDFIDSVEVFLYDLSKKRNRVKRYVKKNETFLRKITKKQRDKLSKYASLKKYSILQLYDLRTLFSQVAEKHKENISDKYFQEAPF